MNLNYLIIIKLSVVCAYVLASTWPHSAMFQTSTSSGDLQSALVQQASTSVSGNF